jgi:hypothetical protein
VTSITCSPVEPDAGRWGEADLTCSKSAPRSAGKRVEPRISERYKIYIPRALDIPPDRFSNSALSAADGKESRVEGRPGRLNPAGQRERRGGSVVPTPHP